MNPPSFNHFKKSRRAVALAAFFAFFFIINAAAQTGQQFHFIYRISFPHNEDSVLKLMFNAGSVNTYASGSAENAQLNKLMNDNTLIDCYADSSLTIARYLDDVPAPIRLKDGTLMNQRGPRMHRTLMIRYADARFSVSRKIADSPRISQVCYAIDTAGTSVKRTGKTKRIGRWRCIEYQVPGTDAGALVYASRELPRNVNPITWNTGISYGIVRIEVQGNRLELVRFEKARTMPVPEPCRGNDAGKPVDLLGGMLVYFDKVISGQKR